MEDLPKGEGGKEERNLEKLGQEEEIGEVEKIEEEEKDDTEAGEEERDHEVGREAAHGVGKY